MGIAVFFLLALVVAAVVIHPLLPGRTKAQATPILADGDIERAVRKLRRARTGTESLCPHCGTAYRSGDLFCVRCGGELPQGTVVLDGSRCPSCGTPSRQGDQFCAKCGHDLAVEEAA